MTAGRASMMRRPLGTKSMNHRPASLKSFNSILCEPDRMVLHANDGPPVKSTSSRKCTPAPAHVRNLRNRMVCSPPPELAAGTHQRAVRPMPWSGRPRVCMHRTLASEATCSRDAPPHSILLCIGRLYTTAPIVLAFVSRRHCCSPNSMGTWEFGLR